MFQLTEGKQLNVDVSLRSGKWTKKYLMSEVSKETFEVGPISTRRHIRERVSSDYLQMTFRLDRMEKRVIRREMTSDMWFVYMGGLVYFLKHLFVIIV